MCLLKNNLSTTLTISSAELQTLSRKQVFILEKETRNTCHVRIKLTNTKFATEPTLPFLPTKISTRGQCGLVQPHIWAGRAYWKMKAKWLC